MCRRRARALAAHELDPGAGTEDVIIIRGRLRLPEDAAHATPVVITITAIIIIITTNIGDRALYTKVSSRALKVFSKKLPWQTSTFTGKHIFL